MDESKIELTERLRAEGRWVEASNFKETVRADLRAKGMGRQEAVEASWEAMAEAYPPLPVMEATAEPASISGRVHGLGDIPASWGTLPANASLQSELNWVQANRLVVVEERPSGATRVHLDRARSPAPSQAALGWLETSIRVYSKYVDVLAKSLKDEADEVDNVRRERMRIEEIQQLLDEMDQRMAEDMLADASATVRERVRSVVPDWCRLCGIDESQRQLLEGHACHLVMGLLKAAGVEVETNARQDASTI